MRRGNIIYLVGLIAIFSIAVWMRWILPSVPFLNNDSWGYLQSAISNLAEGETNASYRGFFYPTILWGILKFWPHFSAITIIQHGAGLFAGVLLVIAWERMRIFLPTETWIYYVHRILGCVMLAVYTISNASISYEHSVLPEALFPLVTILCILAATEFSRRVFIAKKRNSHILACILVILACAAYYLKPAWGLTTFTAMAPLFVAWMAAPSLNKLLPFIIGGFLVLIFFEIPQRYIHHKKGEHSAFLPITLACSSGEIVYEILKQDASLPLSDSRKKLADLLLPEFERAIRHPRFIPFGYSKLNPDSLIYDGAIRTLRNAYQGDFERLSATCYEYYGRAWKQYPFAMIGKIVSQLFYFYCPWKSVNYSQAQDLQIERRLKNSMQVLIDRPTYSWFPYQEYRNKVSAYLAQPPHISFPPVLVTLSTILNPLYMPIALFATIAATRIIFSKNTLFYHLRPAAFWCLYLLSFNFAMTLTIAVIHMTAVDRYHFSQTIFSILSQCFAVIFLICFVRQLYKKRFLSTYELKT